jgi:hypothetical protein
MPGLANLWNKSSYFSGADLDFAGEKSRSCPKPGGTPSTNNSNIPNGSKNVSVGRRGVWAFTLASWLFGRIMPYRFEEQTPEAMLISNGSHLSVRQWGVFPAAQFQCPNVGGADIYIIFWHFKHQDQVWPSASLPRVVEAENHRSSEASTAVMLSKCTSPRCLEARSSAVAFFEVTPGYMKQQRGSKMLKPFKLQICNQLQPALIPS